MKILNDLGNFAPVEVEMHYDGEFPAVEYHNRGGRTAYVTKDDTNSEGSLVFAFADVPSAQFSPASRYDWDSRARYGEQSLELGASDWRQSWWFADQLALQLIEWTGWPIPVSQPVEILPDPRIQTGDVARIQDPTGSMVDGLFRVLGYQVQGQGPVVTMTVTVRPLYRPGRPQDAGLDPDDVLDPGVAEIFPG